MRRLPVALLATVPLLLGVATSAHAEYGPGASIVSADYLRLEQGDDATTDADITPDGRYVVLQTRATNFFADDDPDPAGTIRRGGIFRFDRETGRLQLVADGNAFATDAEGAQTLRGAANPSVSADGRRVVFSTAQALAPQDTNHNVDVYVRDMDVPVGADRQASGAYTLVSARDGGDAPATYAPAALPQASGDAGADVWRNTSISADGNRVVFRTAPDAVSDLPDHAAADVPGGQVFVRDLAARRTTLITRTEADGSPAGGAAGAMVLSDDGTTVVWSGAHAAAQTRFLNGEHIDPDVNFYLWRRLDGSVTRRITGLADPDDPACDGTSVTLSSSSTGPCYGPLTSQEEDGASLVNITPAVSPDGYQIVFLTTAGLRPTSINNPGPDLFITDMHPGLTRKEGTFELTRDGSSLDPRVNAPIDSVAMAADGRHLVVGTVRTNFNLPLFAPVGTFRSTATSEELYVFDLVDHTIDRVVRAQDGSDASAGQGAGPSPTLTADGSTVAFTSQSTNLFYGDANGTADAFVTSLVPPRSSEGPPPVDPNATPPGGFEIGPSGENEDEGLVLSLKRRTKDGGLDASIVAPGPGTFRVTASASVAATRAGRSSKVVVATASRKVTKKGRVTVALVLSRKYAGLLKRSKRVVVTVSPRFTPVGSKSQLDARARSSSFVRPVKRAKKPASKKSTKKSSSKKSSKRHVVSGR